MSIYDCPHCGEKTFNPLTKALAGPMNSKGRACKACGGKCVNGQVSAVIRMILSLLMGAAAGYVLNLLEVYFHSRSKRMSLSVAFVLLTVGVSMLQFEVGGVRCCWATRST